MGIFEILGGICFFIWVVLMMCIPFEEGEGCFWTSWVFFVLFLTCAGLSA